MGSWSPAAATAWLRVWEARVQGLASAPSWSAFPWLALHRSFVVVLLVQLPCGAASGGQCLPAARTPPVGPSQGVSGQAETPF